MKFIVFLFVFAQVWIPNLAEESTLKNLTQGIKTLLVEAVESVNNNLLPLENILNEGCVQPPLECPNSNITFWLSTRNKPAPTMLTEAPVGLRDSKSHWIIIIHGYTKSHDEIPNPQLREAYHKRGDYNILSVDYAPLARDKCYLAAVHNVPLISKCVAEAIDQFVDLGVFEMKDLHVIGYSLGAQIAGRLYEFLKHKKPGRVTGLDPASPLFDGIINQQITMNSGDFVDIIHTNALAKGQTLPNGHVDYYVNGGSIQPGCFSNNNGSFSSCNHDRSTLYFAESINSETGFWGIPCNNFFRFVSGDCNTTESHLVVMGEDVPHSARGIFYLQTNSQSPFALGKVTGYQ